jgi:hypothetical protein
MAKKIAEKHQPWVGARRGAVFQRSVSEKAIFGGWNIA